MTFYYLDSSVAAALLTFIGATLGTLYAVVAVVGIFAIVAVVVAPVLGVVVFIGTLLLGLPWFLAGCGVTLVSLFVQFTLVHHTPPPGMARMSPHDLAAFVRAWDGHRFAINLWHDGVLLNVGSLVVAG